MNLTESTLIHIYTKHRDLAEKLGLNSIDELKNTILAITENPDETRVDRFDPTVKYFLKKMDNQWIIVISVLDTIKTAYLIGTKSYKKFREKRWR